MNKPIRILHVVTHMNRAGLESMIMNYYRNIDRSQIQFDFLTHRNGEKDFDKEINSLGGKIYNLPKLNPFSISYLREINLFFKKHKDYKIIHSHLDTMSTYPLKYAKKNGVPIRVAHAHNTSAEKNIKYLLKYFSKKQMHKYATHYFSCSKDAGIWTFGDKKIKVLNNAIESNKFIYNKAVSIKIKEELKLKDKFVIGHIGRFSKQKNHSYLIDIFYEVYKDNNNSALILIGEGELLGNIKSKVKQLGLDQNVFFLGLRSDIPDLLQAMDVFVFPSLFEGLGIAAIEAQAAGLPTIVSEAIPNEAFITQKIQMLSLKASTSDWANQILKHSSGYIREDNVKDIIKAGYDININVSWLENFYISNSK